MKTPEPEKIRLECLVCGLWLPVTPVQKQLQCPGCKSYFQIRQIQDGWELRTIEKMDSIS